MSRAVFVTSTMITACSKAMATQSSLVRHWWGFPLRSFTFRHPLPVTANCTISYISCNWFKRISSAKICVQFLFCWTPLFFGAMSPGNSILRHWWPLLLRISGLKLWQFLQSNPSRWPRPLSTASVQDKRNNPREGDNGLSRQSQICPTQGKVLLCHRNCYQHLWWRAVRSRYFQEVLP